MSVVQVSLSERSRAELQSLLDKLKSAVTGEFLLEQVHLPESSDIMVLLLLLL